MAFLTPHLDIEPAIKARRILLRELELSRNKARLELCGAEEGRVNGAGGRKKGRDESPVPSPMNGPATLAPVNRCEDSS